MKKATTIICCLALAACGWFFGNMNKSPGIQTIVAAPTFSYDLLLSQMEQRSKSAVSSVPNNPDTIFIHDTVTVTKEKVVRSSRPETSGVTALYLSIPDLTNEMVREEQTKDTIKYIHNANEVLASGNDNHSTADTAGTVVKHRYCHCVEQ